MQDELLMQFHKSKTLELFLTLAQKIDQPENRQWYYANFQGHIFHVEIRNNLFNSIC
jgi:hypothetical protein